MQPVPESTSPRHRAQVGGKSGRQPKERLATRGRFRVAVPPPPLFQTLKKTCMLPSRRKAHDANACRRPRVSTGVCAQGWPGSADMPRVVKDKNHHALPVGVSYILALDRLSAQIARHTLKIPRGEPNMTGAPTSRTRTLRAASNPPPHPPPLSISHAHVHTTPSAHLPTPRW
jgi:hypothetical protein